MVTVSQNNSALSGAVVMIMISSSMSFSQLLLLFSSASVGYPNDASSDNFSLMTVT